VRTYIVNLKRRADRRQRIEALLPAFLEPEFTTDWEGPLDGKDLAADALAGYGLFDWKFFREQRVLLLVWNPVDQTASSLAIINSLPTNRFRRSCDRKFRQPAVQANEFFRVGMLQRPLRKDIVDRDVPPQFLSVVQERHRPPQIGRTVPDVGKRIWAEFASELDAGNSLLGWGRQDLP
jgi:hypothetical protein